MKTCLYCGKSFVQERKGQELCSPECKRERHKQTNRVRDARKRRLPEFGAVAHPVDRLALAIIARAYLDSVLRQDPDTGEEIDQVTRFGARVWMNDTGREWAQVLAPDVEMPAIHIDTHVQPQGVRE